MVDVAEVNLIECPDCKRIILDNVNYCRFCGHDFNEVVDESSGRLSRFLKNPLKGAVIDDLRYCIDCKADVRDYTKDFCDNCGTVIPYQGVNIFCSCGSVQPDSRTYCSVCSNKGRKKRLTAEEFYQIWHNQVIIPLSNEYNKDLSKNNFKKYFNLSNEECNHIIYKIIYNLLFDKIEGNSLEFFKFIVEETKENYKDIEKAIMNLTEKTINEMFNSEGVSSFNNSTIQQAFTETIETPHIQNKHGTGTKVLATAVAGPLGFVATSGVKQETKTKQIQHKGKYFHQKVSLTKEKIIYETYEDNNSSGFKYSMNHDVSRIIIDWKDVKDFEDNYFILNSGETIRWPSFTLTMFARKTILAVVGSTNDKLNSSFFGTYTSDIVENAKSIIIGLIKEQININKIEEPKNNSMSEFEALEKIMNMYKEGLLTDEEFAAMKQNIIGNIERGKTEKEDDTSKDNESSSKFCGNCGAEIVENSKFCIKCGNKLD